MLRGVLCRSGQGVNVAALNFNQVAIDGIEFANCPPASDAFLKETKERETCKDTFNCKISMMPLYFRFLASSQVFSSLRWWLNILLPKNASSASSCGSVCRILSSCHVTKSTTNYWTAACWGGNEMHFSLIYPNKETTRERLPLPVTLPHPWATPGKSNLSCSPAAGQTNAIRISFRAW